MKKFGGYTIEELQKHFNEKNISQGFIPQADFSEMDTDDVEVYKSVNKTLKSSWNEISKNVGSEIDLVNYSKDNPLIAMRDGLGNMLSEKGLEMLNDSENNEDFWEMINQLMSVVQTEEQAKALLDNSVETVMEIMKYPELSEIIKQNPVHGDFSKKSKNYPAMDFNKQYYHTRASTKMQSLDEYKSIESESGTATNATVANSVNIEEQVEIKISKYDFWNSLSEQDKQIIELKMNGLTQKEIAEKLGYQTHSAIGKRLSSIKEQLKKITA